MDSSSEAENSREQDELPNPLPELVPGVVIDGKFRIDRVIGRGGMGVVAAATHLDLDEPVALKFLQVPESDTPDDFRARFALEARVCAKLRNEHIARVHDVGEWQGKAPFMVMELLDGVDLRRVLRAERTIGIGRAVGFVVQICEGLAEAHAQGIVHRDLKPPNIFITKRADGSELVKVLDFGISKWAEELGELTKTGVMLGSPKYMSPEQLNGSLVDARADIWSIGAMLYLMLTGRPPYDFPNVAQTFMAIATGSPPPMPSSIDPTISPALESVILRCLTHDREKRIGNVAELAGELLRAVDSPLASGIQAQLASVLEPTAVSFRSAGPLSSTTGSFAAFAIGTTGAFKPVLTMPSASSPAPTAQADRRRRWTVAGAAAALFALTAVIGSRPAGSSNAASAPSGDSHAEKAVAPKALATEHATRLVATRAPEAAPVLVQVRRSVAHAAAPRPVESAAPAPATTASAVAKLARPAATAANPLEDRQ